MACSKKGYVFGAFCCNGKHVKCRGHYGLYVPSRISNELAFYVNLALLLFEFPYSAFDLVFWKTEHAQESMEYTTFKLLRRNLKRQNYWVPYSGHPRTLLCINLSQDKFSRASRKYSSCLCDGFVSVASFFTCAAHLWCQLTLRSKRRVISGSWNLICPRECHWWTPGSAMINTQCCSLLQPVNLKPTLFSNEKRDNGKLIHYFVNYGIKGWKRLLSACIRDVDGFAKMSAHFLEMNFHYLHLQY